MLDVVLDSRAKWSLVAWGAQAEHMTTKVPLMKSHPKHFLSIHIHFKPAVAVGPDEISERCEKSPLAKGKWRTGM